MDAERHTAAPGRIALRHYLSLVILAALLPLIAFLAFAVVRSAQADRAAAEQRFVDNAHLLAGMVESSLVANVAIIRSLGDAELQPSGAAAPVVLDRLGRIFGGTMTRDLAATPATDRRRNWSLSNLINIEPGVAADIALTIPLDAPGAGTVTLVADAREITRNIDFGDSATSDMLVAVVDGNGHVIARSANEDQFIGRPVPTWQALLDVRADRGVFEAEALEGGTIAFGFSTIRGTPGWVVVIGTPKAIFDARWREPITMLVLAGMLAIAAALLLAAWLSTRITGPISALVARSRGIAAGDPAAHLPLKPTPIDELARLQHAQSAAHARLAERAAQLSLSSQRYHAIAKVGALVTWRREVGGRFLDVEGWLDLTGQTADEAHGNGWIARIHPEDLPATLEAWSAGTHGDAPMNFEMRVQTADGGWTWMQTRAAAIKDADGRTVEWIGTLESIDERKRQHLQMSHLAHHDALTGLPNRIRLHDHLAAVRADAEHGRRGALLYIDLDRFKQANDTFGHAVGDELLRKVADRLQRLIRPSDLAARLGGDEFAIVLRDAGDTDLALMIAMRVVKSLANPFEIDGRLVEIGASVGIALVSDTSLDVAGIIWQADAALYQAKAGGRNRWTFYQPEPAQQSRA